MSDNKIVGSYIGMSQVAVAMETTWMVPDFLFVYVEVRQCVERSTGQ